MSITALRDDYGDIIGYLLIGTDNSVRKRVESELNAAMAAAEKANSAKSEFLSSMSHECARRSTRSSASPSSSKTDRRCRPRAEAQHRPDSQGRVVPAGADQRDPGSRADRVGQVDAVAGTDRAGRGHARVPGHDRAAGAETRHRNDVSAVRDPYYVEADRTRIKQVLINLLFNAIKYNEPGARLRSNAR